jgi:excisionase family DNA binding protein
MTARLAYSIPEAALAVGVSESTIRRAVRSGSLPVKYPSGRPVIRAVDLEAWLDAAPDERVTA